jgi:hypothetical protein
MTIEDYIRQHTVVVDDHYNDIKKSFANEDLSIEYNAYQGPVL